MPLRTRPTASVPLADSSKSARSAAFRLAAILLGSGTLHLAKPAMWDQLVPTQLPGEARTYVYASGVAELAVGAALLAPQTRKMAGGAAALLFVAVLPGNIKMAADLLKSDKTTTPMKAGGLLRLPLQIPLVTEALKVRSRA
ncbi:DoxX family protein [Antrihabitans cavernicola]|uniref:DoxX family membrane protein n=1 Tax=Antrihabitans cavernicola TaxID=2495913 RepID=A0A5A7SD07_9NOCA|nr:MauE/DoxX family redox-associated membrane protein [Spelaeibacter cavernicola]KAA0024038.1 hypothetical protein FOY51_05565 [Spelaeibacter cavernicola]